LKKIIILFLLLFILSSCSQKEIIIELYCDEGELYGSRCKLVENMIPEITCPKDFPYNEKTKKCESVISIPAPGKYTCKEGYTLTNGKCISDKTYDKVNNKCPVDTSLYNGECKEIKYRNYEYYCPTGRLNDKKCELVDEKSPEIACPTDYTPNKKELTCEKITYKEANQREVKN